MGFQGLEEKPGGFPNLGTFFLLAVWRAGAPRGAPVALSAPEMIKDIESYRFEGNIFCFETSAVTYRHSGGL
jgi:hypothetical protein